MYFATEQPAYHIDITAKGSAPNLLAVMSVLHAKDSDWPIRTDDGVQLTTYRPRCNKCNGIHYVRPRFRQQQVVSLAKQFGVDLRIKVWVRGDKCGRK